VTLPETDAFLHARIYSSIFLLDLQAEIPA